MKRTRKPDQPRSIGLARTLSKLGHCSRNQGFALVRSGRVAVNGAVRRDPEFPVPLQARITVDGRPISSAGKLYLMMNKPRGLVTTTSDEKGRPTVYSLLDPDLPRVSPVGRLDLASEGLLLFTNDTEWAARITSPDCHVEKTYHVQIAAVADDALLARLSVGVSPLFSPHGVSDVETGRTGGQRGYCRGPVWWLSAVSEAGGDAFYRERQAWAHLSLVRR